MNVLAIQTPLVTRTKFVVLKKRIHAQTPYVALALNVNKLVAVFNVYARLVIPEMPMLIAVTSTNAYKIHVVEIPFVSIQLAVMIVNVSVASLAIHLRCAHQLKTIVMIH